MILSLELIDLSRVTTINVMGKGGKERDIAVLLPNWKRVGAALYDYEINYQGQIIRIEIKKQQNLQWFDSGKYYALSSVDREIRVMFVNHDKGDIVTILVAELGRLIDWLCENRKKDGWTEEVLKVGAEFKERYPSLQFKAPVHVATLSREVPELFETLYSRQ